MAVGSRNHDSVGVYPGDAEVAAEVDEVERTQRAGELDEVHLARAADEDRDVVDLGAVEVEPEVGDGVVGLALRAGEPLALTRCFQPAAL